MSVNLFKNGTLTKIARGLKDATVTITNNLLATKSGTALDAVQGKVLDDKITKVNSSLTNEDAETFNFGVKDGVRGFFTDPSRADDSFIPFSGGNIEVLGGVTLPRFEYINFTVSKSCHVYAGTSAFVTIAKNGVSISPKLLTDSSLGYGISVLYDVGELNAGDVLTAYSDNVGTYAINYFTIS